MDSREKKKNDPKITTGENDVETPKDIATANKAPILGSSDRSPEEAFQASTASSPVRLDTDQAEKAANENVDSGASNENILEIPGLRDKRLSSGVPISATDEVIEVDPLAAMTPVERLLALPELPRLERENRARLQMQTPTRLHFYWSLKEDPWTMLRKSLSGDTGSYTLVLKLIELRSDTEQVHNADAEGSWWFDVRPDGEYQAEIGFYAPNRPYIRIVYSNIVVTPRKKPSVRKAAEAQWTLTADKFAKVLDVAGFAQDAVDVAIAGDDAEVSATATRSALRDLTGDGNVPISVDDEDIRFALLEMAAGQKLEELRWKVGADLFAYLQSVQQDFDSGRARSVLNEHFEIDDLSFDTEEFGPAVYGVSLVNFPRTRSRRTARSSGPGYSPESSHSYRGVSRS